MIADEEKWDAGKCRNALQKWLLPPSEARIHRRNPNTIRLQHTLTDFYWLELIAADTISAQLSSYRLSLPPVWRV
jgi:hypothetical protein